VVHSQAAQADSHHLLFDVFSSAGSRISLSSAAECDQDRPALILIVRLHDEVVAQRVRYSAPDRRHDL
jgi:hypothetical protein